MSNPHHENVCEAMAGPAWQTAETAPKDGTEILGYWDKSDCHGIVYWCSDNASWCSEASICNAPTHWQPLTTPARDHEGAQS